MHEILELFFKQYELEKKIMVREKMKRRQRNTVFQLFRRFSWKDHTA